MAQKYLIAVAASLLIAASASAFDVNEGETAHDAQTAEVNEAAEPAAGSAIDLPVNEGDAPTRHLH